MKRLNQTPQRRWAAWLLILALFGQAFLPALAQAAARSQPDFLGDICSASAIGIHAAQQHDAAASLTSDHALNPHCAYCLLGGAGAPPPLALPIPLPQPIAAAHHASPKLGASLARLDWAVPPLRGPPSLC